MSGRMEQLQIEVKGREKCHTGSDLAKHPKCCGHWQSPSAGRTWSIPSTPSSLPGGDAKV